MPPELTRSELIANFNQPYWAFISQADRDQAVKDGNAMPDGSYPVRNCDELDKAVHAVGRGGAEHDAIRRHIIRMKAKHNCADDAIPDNWNSDGSLKDDGSSNATSTSAHAAGTDPQAPIDSPAVKNNDEKELEGDDLAGGDHPVNDAIAALGTALAALETAQAADPDDDSDPNDKKVDADIAQLKSLYETLKNDQAADDANDPRLVADKPTQDGGGSGNMAAKDGELPIKDPVDEDGNVNPTEKCANPDCGHMASSHENMPGQGENTGACSMANCGCEQMELAKIGGDINADTSQGSDGAAENGGGGADNAGGSDQQNGGNMAADPAAPAAPSPSLNEPPAVTPDNSNMGPVFTIPVGIIEGQPTGDRRRIANGALTSNIPPLPLMFLKTSPHDPGGYSPNLPAVMAGRIDSVEFVPGEGGTRIAVAKGYYLPTDDGLECAAVVDAMGRCGVSADVQVVSMQTTGGEIDPEIGFPIDDDAEIVLTAGVIMGFTVCPFPAFNGCYIVNGDGTTQPEPIPQATEPATPAIVASGGQFINYLTARECEPCMNGHVSLLASATPAHPPRAWFTDPAFGVQDDDPRLVAIYSVKRGGKLVDEGRLGCPVRVLESGQVYGHIATWEQCHISYPNSCVTAPHSRTDYAHFVHGIVRTAEGDDIVTGVLTVGTDHADGSLDRWDTMLYYAHTGFAVADVVIGEDAFGIWVAGALRPGATTEQVEALRRGAPSGDWRNDELVACLVVNTPGFPMSLTAEGKRSLTAAAGTIGLFLAGHPDGIPQKPEDEVAPLRDEALRLALRPLVAEQRRLNLARIFAESNS